MTLDEEYKNLKATIGLSTAKLAKILQLDARYIRKWGQASYTSQARAAPHIVMLLLRLWADPRLPKSLRPQKLLKEMLKNAKKIPEQTISNSPRSDAV